MRRQLGRLSALTVARAKEPGMYHDGGGLYLQVSRAGTKSWIFRFMLRHRAREMGLGPLRIVSLADARAKALSCHRLLLDGTDPIEVRRAQAATLDLNSVKGMIFTECADAYIAAHRAGWRNPKHIAQWKATLDTYAGPIFGSLPVQEVDVGLIMKALEPIWTVKIETATRVRGRIEAVLDWATARGYRRGENPARWRGHLQNLLPKSSKVRRVEHHPALPYDEISAFMSGLRGQGGIAPRALEFLILTATRTSETIGARWEEFDLEEFTWTIPAARIKAGKEHRVPLSPPALAIVNQLAETRVGEFVFPGGKEGRSLSNMALLALLKRIGRQDLTVHGFRSTFRDWAAERTNFPREVAEMALAHAVSDKVEAAYRRGDLLEKRRRLMEDWSRQCGL